MARDGELRGFVNVCRHRGHIVVEGSGCRETLQCPYHAWTYGLDGELRKAPRSEREPGFDASAFSLLPVSVDTWGPFVFVNPGSRCRRRSRRPSVTSPSTSRRAASTSTGIRFHSHHEWEQEVNWKVALENYLECYHCAVAHPGFSKVIDVDPDAYRLVVGATASSQLGPVRQAALAGRGKVPYDPNGEVRQSQFHFLFPNTTINIAPGPQNLSIERWVPAGPRTTVEVTDYFFDPDESPRADPGAARMGQPGRRGGRLARPLRPARARLGPCASGPADAREREADRRLPAARVRRGTTASV